MHQLMINNRLSEVIAIAQSPESYELWKHEIIQKKARSERLNHIVDAPTPPIMCLNLYYNVRQNFSSYIKFYGL